MAVYLTEAQARKLGFTPKKSGGTKKKGMGRGGAATRCVACGEVFTRDVDEDRHLAETPHRRYEAVLE